MRTGAGSEETVLSSGSDSKGASLEVRKIGDFGKEEIRLVMTGILLALIRRARICSAALSEKKN